LPGLISVARKAGEIMNVLAAKTHWQGVADCGWGQLGVSTRRDPIREQSAYKEL
jgi:hypothetical protein